MAKSCLSTTKIVIYKDTMNCPEKVMKISHFNHNQSAHSIYLKIELCYFSLDQMRDKDTSAVREMFQYIPHHCDPHLNQTKFNDLLPLTIDGVLMVMENMTICVISGKISIFE